MVYFSYIFGSITIPLNFSLGFKMVAYVMDTSERTELAPALTSQLVSPKNIE